MSKWRDRGYVLDSDEEDIALTSPSTTPPSSLRPSDLQDDAPSVEADAESGKAVENPASGSTVSPDRQQQIISREREEQHDVVMQDAGEDLNEDLGKEEGVEATESSEAASRGAISQDETKTWTAAQQTRKKPEPVVLITQSRRPTSPDELPSKAVRTYSKKFNPAAARRLSPSGPRHAALEDTTNHVATSQGSLDLLDEVSPAPGIYADSERLRLSSEPMPAAIGSQRRSSVSSSDLSDVDMEVLSSSPQHFFPSFSDTRRAGGDSGTGPSTLALSDTPDALRGNASRQSLAAFAAPLRTFRTRRAIQLHPYMIESEQYRRSLKARGLRPVQVATNSQQPRERQETQDVEFHNRESQALSHDASNTQETTPPDSSASSDPPHQRRLLELVANDDEEFPDIDAILRRNVIGGVQQGFKRRKTLETPTKNRHLNTASSTSGARGRLKSLNLNRRSSAPGSHGLLPPSPPRTSSPSNVDPISATNPHFRLPRGMTPVAAPTPLPSSPERVPSASARRARQVVESSEDENGEMPGADAESDQSSSPNSETEERQLLRMRRRIKGVLPASWLKLDEKLRRPQPARELRTAQQEMPRSTAPARGVAQRKTASSSTTPARPRERIVISDQSDASDSPVEEVFAPHPAQTRLASPSHRRPMAIHDDFGEVEEHDEFDAMLPSASRLRVRKGKSTKRQSRLTDTFVQQSDQVPQSRSMASDGATGRPASIRERRTKRKPTSKRRAKFKKPVQLSILDTTAGTVRQPAPLPQFVRLAARQARQRADHGRHSPTHKVIRLATREDTQEALEPLRQWNAGNLRQTWNPQEPAREAIRASASDSPSAVTTHRIQGTIPPHPIPAIPPRTTAANVPRHGLLSDHHEQRGPKANRSHLHARGMLERNNRMRPAQLEAVGNSTNRDLDFLTYAAPPSRLMEIFNRDRAATSAYRFRLERFLKDRDDRPDEADGRSGPTPNANNVDAANRRSRKRLARRIDVERIEYRQPDEPLPADLSSVTGIEAASVPAESQVLQDLGPFGARYPTDFDVRPLELGTYFSSSTFIGSGDFDDCLTLRNRDLDLPAGRITIEAGGQSFRWSAWDEDVSAGFTTILTACMDDLQALDAVQQAAERQDSMKDASARVNYVLRSLVRYLSGCLHFIDPIDRSSCINRLSRFVDEFMDMIEEQSAKHRVRVDGKAQADRLLFDSLLFLLCLTAQVIRIARHPVVDARSLASLQDRAIHMSRRILLLAMPGRFTAIRTFLEEHRQHAKRDSGIQEDNVAVKCIVVLNHVLSSIAASSTLSDVLNRQLSRTVSTSCNVHALDQIWYDAFSVQPLLEIDTRGLYRPKSRFRASNDNWALVKCLLQRTFDLYPATSRTRNATLNEYVRACLTRAYHLVVRWGWRKCETVLGTVYDFFARNSLAQLHKEESRGSPRFLEDIDKDPSVDVDIKDSAFHVFLKSLVVGLRAMQDIYPHNKVRGFAWRFIPNHGRTYQKDQRMTQIQLDALRNHHDLLCTLYWVLPTGAGPRLQMIKDLVDHTNSHREACRLSVHAWGILARYQLSQQNASDGQDSLASWFKEMVAVTISQYRLARSEAESQYTLQRARGSTDISTEMLEATIASNQRSILATLLDLLQASRQAIHVAKTWTAARNLVELSNVVEVFKLYDPDQPRLFTALMQGLDVIGELLRLRTSLTSARDESQQTSEDSQEYGDWSFMDQVIESGPETPERKASEVAFLQEPLANFLSTCFGSERSPDDDLLKRLVEVWTTVSHECVKERTLDWSSFLDMYSTMSWFQLRDTEHRHKYTAYFLSCVIKADKTALDEHRGIFMKAWLVSLLERESLLKFQHQLTASLLGRASQEPLLNNLPFAANSQNGQYNITLADIRARRASLIGSIFFNMRASLECTAFSHPSVVPELRREYIEMLKQAMQHMRRTYEQLQDLSGRLGTSHLAIQGAYVAFVQQIISLMQQYTSDICPIDSFFVDSSAFPLPADDPTYVVGRLKSYVSKLSESKACKQLAMFIQTVSERAALDTQQPYLVGQLQQALGGRMSSSLRQIFMAAILPAYLSCAESHPCGWVLALPLVEAATSVIDSLMYELDFSDETSLDIDVASITAMLQTLHEWTLALSQEPLAHILRSSNLRLLTAVYGALDASLTVIEYIGRSTGKASNAVNLIRNLVELGDYFVQVLKPTTSPLINDLDAELPITPDIPISIPTIHTPWQDTLDFSIRGLRDELSKAWSQRGDNYFVARGGNFREVVVDLGSKDEEIESAREAIFRAKKGYDAVFGTGNVDEADDLAANYLAEMLLV